MLIESLNDGRVFLLDMLKGVKLEAVIKYQVGKADQWDGKVLCSSLHSLPMHSESDTCSHQRELGGTYDIIACDSIDEQLYIIKS